MTLDLLNFGSGYRHQLHELQGRGAYESMVRIEHCCKVWHDVRVRHSVAIYGQLLLFCDQRMCEKTKACARRPGAAASVERRRRERRTLLAVPGRRASRRDKLAASQAFERMHIL